MYSRPASPKARRNSPMLCTSVSSVTMRLGHTAASIVSLETSSPMCSTRYRSTAKVFGRNVTSRPSRSRQPRARSSTYSSNTSRSVMVPGEESEESHGYPRETNASRDSPLSSPGTATHHNAGESAGEDHRDHAQTEPEERQSRAAANEQ